MLEKAWNPRVPKDTLRKDLIDIHPTASRFTTMLEKVKHHAKQSMNNAFDYAKQKNPTPSPGLPVEQSEDKKINKVIKERRLRGKLQREYVVRYKNPVHEDECLAESEIPESDRLLRRFRHERRLQALVCL
ncbi:hypothetical protein O181_055889 [Austropuccinia psidii MF-1]|uniref:Uncharacterized protein n=1 Tax=Austropuccinia psidii MF-1 TaxID=1389203 RepID=A0A9Q3HV38_9BASI|nr:hypothetical protein [Austropuccinia psidii MF-1]